MVEILLFGSVLLFGLAVVDKEDLLLVEEGAKVMLVVDIVLALVGKLAELAVEVGSNNVEHQLAV